jgi:hypothetical protein
MAESGKSSLASPVTITAPHRRGELAISLYRQYGRVTDTELALIRAKLKALIF